VKRLIAAGRRTQRGRGGGSARLLAAGREMVCASILHMLLSAGAARPEVMTA